MAAVLERKSSSSLFSETAAQRFRRESQEVWEQIKIDENGEEKQTDPDPVEIKIKKLSLGEKKISTSTPSGKGVVTAPSRSRAPVKMTAPAKLTKDTELFPKKVKSKFIKTRPASWEKDFEKEEKEIEKTKPKTEKPTIRRLSERTKLTQARKI